MWRTEAGQDDVDALTIPCPLSACRAPKGKRCVSWVTGRTLGTPHAARTAEAEHTAPGLW